MKTVKYIGDYEEVEIAATGQIVKRGESVSVDDDELAKALLEQESNWERSSAKEVSDSG